MDDGWPYVGMQNTDIGLAPLFKCPMAGPGAFCILLVRDCQAACSAMIMVMVVVVKNRHVKWAVGWPRGLR